MSVAIISNNQFNYQDIPANALIYRAGTSGFEAIQPAEGVLMSTGTSYYFKNITAYDIVKNYSDNSIIVADGSSLTSVPVEGTSENKLLRFIGNKWKIVDFSMYYLKPELYDPSSWQLWIADYDINVINIPKDVLSEYCGVRYNEESNQFDIISPALFNTTEAYYAYANSTTAFMNVYTNAIINKGTESDDISLYSCFYSSDLTKIFDGSISSDIVKSTIPGTAETFTNVTQIHIIGGIYIENYDTTADPAICCAITDGTRTDIYKGYNFTRNISNFITDGTNAVVPVQLNLITSGGERSYSRIPDIYLLILTTSTDTGTYHWYYPRNYMNMYVVRNIAK